MANQYDVVLQITSGHLPDSDRAIRLREFSRELGWRPTDRLDLPAARPIAAAQLLVEHGLENSAVVSFLLSPRDYHSLTYDQRESLLSGSYNNLVDWHVAISGAAVDFVYVRTRVPTSVERRSLSRDNYEGLRSEIFEQIVGRRPNPNIPALDDALIRTVSLWKRALAAELQGAVANSQLAALFNALIFARALEDQRRRLMPNDQDLLVDRWRAADPSSTVRDLLRGVLLQAAEGEVPSYLFPERELTVFDRLDRDTVQGLLFDFYNNRFAPYRYDFAIISKHALSRIYEQYVSLLRQDDSAQLSLIPQMPSEFSDKSYGAVYTPQFIARFFVRFLREHIPPYEFKRLRSMDPACGSGIFLRTLLEFQCDPLHDGFTPDLIDAAFTNAVGLDKDGNAVAATQLSLSLLYLVLTDRLPRSLSVFQRDFFDGNPLPTGAHGTFDTVLLNPPFVSLDVQDPATRVRVADLLRTRAGGRIDLYLAFLEHSIEQLRPGGFGLFVLPHSFLLAKSAEGIREWVLRHCWIQCLADLSAIRVFEDTSVYVVLLIIQRQAGSLPVPSATIVKCQDQVGHALQDAVEGRKTTSKFYSVYDVEQSDFDPRGWFVLAPAETSIKRRLDRLPPLSEFLEVPQGMITGADDVFVLDNDLLPNDDPPLFIALLRDREMRPYVVPRRTSQSIFFPYFKGEKVTEEVLRDQFPKTWAYLRHHRKRLEKRASLRRYRRAWWEPMWPREPDTLLRPKIVVPHLGITPRFALDSKGRFGVSRSPFLVARERSDEESMLRLFLAILNSSACYWYIQTHSHVYRHGYTMLESKTLLRTPVPDVNRWTASDQKRLLALVDRRIRAEESQVSSLNAEIEEIISEAYGLTPSERRVLGLEDGAA